MRHLQEMFSPPEKDEIKADEMRVYLTKTDQEQNDVERLELYGNVKITHEVFNSWDSGVYHKMEQYAVVTNTKQSSPVLWIPQRTPLGFKPMASVII